MKREGLERRGRLFYPFLTDDNLFELNILECVSYFLSETINK